MLTIRDAIAEDAALIRALIQKLAEYDGEADHVRTTEADIARDGFGTSRFIPVQNCPANKRATLLPSCVCDLCQQRAGRTADRRVGKE
jgi:hypothetical protein